MGNHVSQADKPRTVSYLVLTVKNSHRVHFPITVEPNLVSTEMGRFNQNLKMAEKTFFAISKLIFSVLNWKKLALKLNCLNGMLTLIGK